MTDAVLDHGYGCTFDRHHEPTLEIASGDRVTFKCREAADGQITPASTVHDLENADTTRVHSILGPIRIKGAEPGDTVEVRLLSLEHHGWGWTGLTPAAEGALGTALLEDEFPDRLTLRILHVDGQECLRLADNVRIPINPSCGLVGLAPSEPGPHRTLPPRPTGGNMDNRYLRAGSTVYLPVAVEDGLLYLGDCHLAQGDGQSSLYAVEAPMTVTARVILHKGWRIQEPRYVTAPGGRHRHDDMAFYATTSVQGSDLYANAQRAASYMVEWLQERHGLISDDAYILIGIAGNILVNEIVDTPNYGVSVQMPRDIFTD